MGDVREERRGVFSNKLRRKEPVPAKILFSMKIHALEFKISQKEVSRCTS